MDKLKTTIEDAARQALKNQEPLLLSVLRLLLTAIHNREIERKTKSGGAGDLTDEEIMAVIRSEAKKRKDAVAEFTRGGRKAAAEKEAMELVILEKYLPAEMPDEEIERILAPLAQGAIEKDFGKVMGEAMKIIAGRASGDRVSAIVKRMLDRK